MSERLFDKIVKKDQGTYDEKMLPYIEAEAKANFEATVREGEKKKIRLEKDLWESLYNNPSQYNLDMMADSKMTIDAIDEKIKVVKELYKELFNEEMK